MKPEDEIERFFSAYPEHLRKNVERSWEYQLALKNGKITTALEIAAVMVTGQSHSEIKQGAAIIFKKEFPEISN
jgi:hypothetical protein